MATDTPEPRSVLSAKDIKDLQDLADYLTFIGGSFATIEELAKQGRVHEAYQLAKDLRTVTPRAIGRLKAMMRRLPWILRLRLPETRPAQKKARRRARGRRVIGQIIP